MPEQLELEQLPELVSVRCVSKRLGVSRGTLYSWIAKGRIPAYRLSQGALRIPLQGVREFLQKSREGQPHDGRR